MMKNRFVDRLHHLSTTLAFVVARSRNFRKLVEYISVKPVHQSFAQKW
jgi:hypothetical protein